MNTAHVIKKEFRSSINSPSLDYFFSLGKKVLVCKQRQIEYIQWMSFTRRTDQLWAQCRYVAITIMVTRTTVVHTCTNSTKYIT